MKVPKKVLFFSPLRRTAGSLFSGPGPEGLRLDQGGEDEPLFTSLDQFHLCWIHAGSPEQAMDLLDEDYFSLLVLDLRAQSAEEIPHIGESLENLLHRLDHIEDPDLRYGFHRIVAVIDGPDQHGLDQILMNLGRAGVTHVYRRHDEDRHAMGHWLLDKAHDLIWHRRKGRTALCLAAGGITGIYFHLGVMKCLSDCLSGDALNDFDMYFGISAGSIVCTALNLGFSVDEIMAAIAQEKGGRIPAMDLNLLKLKHLNYRAVTKRLPRIMESLSRNQIRQAMNRPVREDSALAVTDILRPPFRSDRFESLIRGVARSANTANEFDDLERELYIGATDQDLREHVLFGSEGYRNLPISKAIQASMSINPAFAAVPIGGRYYEDGAVTRTSNFSEALRRGADLIFVVDPFVPYVSKEAGLAHRKGLLYNVDQNLRTVSYTRFANTRISLIRKHPDVSTYTFLPSNSTRPMLAVNPMDHRPWPGIWRAAYLSTLQRLQALGHRLGGDLAPHDISLDFDRAIQVAEQLEAADRPVFRDFFPDRRPDIRRPPLTRPSR